MKINNVTVFVILLILVLWSLSIPLVVLYQLVNEVIDLSKINILFPTIVFICLGTIALNIYSHFINKKNK